MIIKYYGGNVNKNRLREITKTSKNGVTGFNLIKAANELGLDSCGIEIKIEKEFINKINLPVIAYTIIDNKYNHFMVIYEINFEKNYVLLADPATKIRKMDLEEFKLIYQNIMFLFKPIRKLQKEKSKINFFRYYIFKNKKIIFEIIIYSLILMVLNLLFLLLIRHIINNISLLKEVFIMCLIVLFVKDILYYVRNNILLKFSNKLEFDLTMETFSKVVNLPYSYYRNKTTGEIFSRINDINEIKESFINILVTLFLDTLLIIFFLIFTYYISFYLFVISLLIITQYIIILFIFKSPLTNKINELKKEKSNNDSYIVEALTGFESVKGLNLEKNVISFYCDKFKLYIKKLLSFEKIYNLSDFLKQIISDTSLLITIIIGFKLVLDGKISLADFMIYESVFNIFIDPLKNIVNLDCEFKKLIISVNRIEDLNYYQGYNLSNKNVNRIVFNDVSYSHDDINFVLKNISFKIEKNDKIMLIGENGSGKSTILKMIKGYYQNKNVLINNKNSYSKKVIYLDQNGYLFTDTLYQNIVMNRKIQEQELKNIIEICELEKVISNQMGYYKLIEENGFNISGGERQRILLARALLSDFDVLLIDEGLSEIDVSSERKIIKKIFDKYRNKIIIVISHRYDNMDLFNKVIKLKDGIEIIKKGGKKFV